METTYWSRATSRRSVLRGAGLGVAGLAGAALIGCGSDDDSPASTGTPASQAGAQLTATAVGTQAADPAATPVPADQVRVTPGIYDGPIPPSAAELNPAVNAVRGGVAKMLYLDPPRMDLSRSLSCTIYHTLGYTSNKLTRGIVGPLADPYRVEIEPDLAESWEVSEGGTKHTFHLHKGVKFHNKAPVNGREFTAEDVVKTVEMYSAGSQKDVFSMVESVETPDDYTVVFNLDQPLNDFPLSVAAWSFIYPRELVDDDELRQTVSIGTGPYTQEEWIQKEKSVFKANPDYWEKDALGNALPYLDGVEVYVQNDQNAQQAGVLTHNYGHMAAGTDDQVAQMVGEGKTLVAGRSPVSRGANVNGFQFQMTNPTYQDERIRRAWSLAFDPNEFDLARGGDNQNPDGPYSNAPMPWPLLYDSYPTQKENGPWYAYDPAEASKLMQAAGYTASNPLTVELVAWYYRNELNSLVIPSINQNLPEVNITFREIDNPTYITMISDRNFDAVTGFLWGPPGFSMDQWVYPFYHSAGSLNYGSINDPDLDVLLVAQRAESNADAQKAYWQQIWDRIHDQVYQMWFPERLQRPVHNNYILNMRTHGWMGSYTCYSNDQARNMWLDGGKWGA